MAVDPKITDELFSIAQKIEKRYRKYPPEWDINKSGELEVQMEDGRGYLVVYPSRGEYKIMHVYPYTTQWDETESVDTDIEKHKSAEEAVKRAFQISREGHREIEDLFGHGR